VKFGSDRHIGVGCDNPVIPFIKVVWETYRILGRPPWCLAVPLALVLPGMGLLGVLPLLEGLERHVVDRCSAWTGARCCCVAIADYHLLEGEYHQPPRPCGMGSWVLR